MQIKFKLSNNSTAYLEPDDSWLIVDAQGNKKTELTPFEQFNFEEAQKSHEEELKNPGMV